MCSVRHPLGGLFFSDKRGTTVYKCRLSFVRLIPKYREFYLVGFCIFLYSYKYF